MMNRNVLIALALFLTVSVSAQSFQLQGTTYIGALTSDAAADWTKSWTNFDPKNAVYGEPTDLTTFDGMASSLPKPGEKDITGTLTLDATKVYLLKGFIVVRSGGKLVIPAGTVIRCQADLSTTPKNYASIIVERGGKIEITGTAAKPVVITSAKAVGARERGDWGGLLLAGKAPHNLWTSTSDVQMEGFNGVTFDADLAKFGGTDLADNSGIISYLRLEFGGLAFEVNKEINGLTFGAVGSGTTVNNIQVSYSGDDSFEWFGGTVNSKYLIAWKGTDDDFDTDNGYKGISQFGIGVRDADYFDLTWNASSGSSTSEGFESDNEATGTANVSPYTSCVFSNFTMIGPVPVGSKWSDLSTTAQSAFRRGARIRRNSSQRIVNTIFMGYRNFAMLDGDSCIRNTNDVTALALVLPTTPVDAVSKQIMLSNNLIVNTTAAYSPANSTANGLIEVSSSTSSQAKLDALTAWFKLAANANKVDPVAFTTGTLLVNPLASSTTPDFRPVAGSPALTGGGGKFTGTPISALISGAKEIAAAAKSAPVYPNPISNGNLNFGRTVEVFGIFDMTGKLVGNGFETDHFNVQNLTSGMYFIKMEGQIQKFIVQ